MTREKLTRNWSTIHSASAARPLLNPNNERLGNLTSHSTGHFLNESAVREGVRMFRQYIHSVYLRISSSKFGRKMLALAYWLSSVDPKTDEQYRAFKTIFSMDADSINQILGKISGELGVEVKLQGSLSDAIRVLAPNIRRIQK